MERWFVPGVLKRRQTMFSYLTSVCYMINNYDDDDDDGDDDGDDDDDDDDDDVMTLNSS